MGYILMVLSGLMIVLPLSYPHLFFLSWLALIPALFSLEKKDNNSNKSSFKLGLILGITVITGTGYWLYFPLADFSGLSFFFIIPILLLAFLIGSIFYGFWACLFSYIKKQNRLSPFLLAFSWTGVEYFRYLLLAFFPFGFIGYTQSHFKLLLQLADIGGIFLVSFIVILINGYLYKIIINSEKKALIPLLLIILIVFTYGGYKINHYTDLDSKTLRVGLVHTRISQDKKWLSSNIKNNIEQIFQSTREFNNVKLIITPESVLTFDLIRNEYYRDFFLKKFNAKDIYLQVGSLAIVDEESDKYNSSFLISPGGEILKRYNKQELVLFGEFIPFKNITNSITSINMNSLLPGKEITLFDISPVTWRTLICSEILYPQLLGEEINKSDFIVNQSNEAWFKVSNLHQQMWTAAIFRAVENRLAVIRSGNYTYDGLILPSGLSEVKISFTENNTKSREIEVPLNRDHDPTFYQKHGNYSGYISGLIILLIFGIKLLIKRYR